MRTAGRECASDSMFLGRLADVAQATWVRPQWQPISLLPAKVLPRVNTPPQSTLVSALGWLWCCTGLGHTEQEAPCCVESALAGSHCSRPCKPCVSRLARESSDDQLCQCACCVHGWASVACRWRHTCFHASRTMTLRRWRQTAHALGAAAHKPCKDNDLNAQEV